MRTTIFLGCMLMADSANIIKYPDSANNFIASLAIFLFTMDLIEFLHKIKNKTK